MPSPEDYVAALAALNAEQARDVGFISFWHANHTERHARIVAYTLAANCVRVMQAVAEGRLRWTYRHDGYDAFLTADELKYAFHADLLTAALAVLDGPTG